MSVEIYMITCIYILKKFRPQGEGEGEIPTSDLGFLRHNVLPWGNLRDKIQNLAYNKYAVECNTFSK